MAVDLISPPAPSADYSPLRAHFADGTRTTGQQVPYYEELRPFQDFPDKISGPTVWEAEDYQNYPERWTHVLSEAEVDEISAAAEKFKAAGTLLIDMSKVFLQKRFNRKWKYRKLTENSF